MTCHIILHLIALCKQRICGEAAAAGRTGACQLRGDGV